MDTSHTTESLSSLLSAGIKTLTLFLALITIMHDKLQSYLPKVINLIDKRVEKEKTFIQIDIVMVLNGLMLKVEKPNTTTFKNYLYEKVY